MLQAVQAVKTTYELSDVHKTKLNHQKVFGSKAYVYAHKQKRQYFHVKVTEGIVVGYDLRNIIRNYTEFIQVEEK